MDVHTHAWTETTDKMWSQKLTLSLCDRWAKKYDLTLTYAEGQTEEGVCAIEKSYP